MIFFSFMILGGGDSIYTHTHKRLRESMETVRIRIRAEGGPSS